jgi:hypothetical protein
LERRVGGRVAVLAAGALQHARDFEERPRSGDEIPRWGRDSLRRLRPERRGGRHDHHAEQDAGDGTAG